MQTRVRQLTVDDAEELQRICRETYTDTFADSNTEEDLNAYLDEAYDVDVLRAELNNPQSFFWFLHATDPDTGEEDIAGHLKLNIGDAQSESFAPEALEVERIYIRTRFKRRGLGSILLALADQKAQELGVPSMWLGVWEHNYAAQAFYAKKGYRQIGDHVFTMGDSDQRDLILSKDL